MELPASSVPTAVRPVPAPPPPVPHVSTLLEEISPRTVGASVVFTTQEPLIALSARPPALPAPMAPPVPPVMPLSTECSMAVSVPAREASTSSIMPTNPAPVDHAALSASPVQLPPLPALAVMLPRTEWPEWTLRAARPASAIQDSTPRPMAPVYSPTVTPIPSAPSASKA
jgi:pyruvate dehydrogenase E2 component (dihydrolipoamide acetyltransferase)